MAELGDDTEFEALLACLRDDRGFDVTGYKRPTLVRRVGWRMQELGLDSYGSYLDRIQADQGELAKLFDTLLINVTGFFRDPDAWRALREHAVPRLLELHRTTAEPIRVWSAACSSGEEAYTLAILFAEALGEPQFKARLKIYATDLDEADLERARQGRYGPRTIEAVPPPLRERYFRQEDDTFVFRRDLRRSIIFGRHDLIQDAPIGRLDLLVCRNTLMYFGPKVQRQILRRFHFALRDHGFLFLGKAETLLSHNDLYEPVDLRHRLFVRATHGDTSSEPFVARGRTPRVPVREGGPGSDIVDAALAASPVAHVVVDNRQFLVAANAASRATFGIQPADLGRPFANLPLAARMTGLRPLIEKAAAQGTTGHLSSVPWGHQSRGAWFDVTVTPLYDPSGGPLGVSVAFQDVADRHDLQKRLQAAEASLRDLDARRT